MFKKSLFSILLFTALCFNNLSQGSYHIIGTGNIQNSANTYPSIYGNDFRGVKNQFLVKASEMQASGMSEGNITGLGFEVISPSGSILENFEIEIKATDQNSINSWDNNNLSSHFGPSNFSNVTGWNQHNFSTPFYWDGTSNIIIKTCFYNQDGANNAIMKMSNYSYNALIYRRSNGNPCPATWINGIENTRPNIRLQWLDPSSPPISDFSVSSNSTCSGSVSFTDLSTDNTTSWLWDFGDGNSSNQQNPTHTYSTSGYYDVELISSNNFGSDTTFYTNLIEVNLAGEGPIQSPCNPETQYPGSLNCGITEFNFGDFSKTSLNSVEGYSDFTCGTINLFAGQNYELFVVHNGNALQNFTMWIDYNNNGEFDLPNEEIYSNIAANISESTIQIPANATLDTPLRLRIMADNTFQGGLAPCTNPVNGQAEDYSVMITTNTNPPEAEFNSDKNYSCNGIIQFSDLSTNAPYSWFWQFGDGSTSLMQNPQHTYANNGVYDVMLISGNNYGTDTILKPQHIVIDNNYELAPSICNPSTLNHFEDYGIEKVEFANINNLSVDGEEGYMDFSCDYQAFVEAGENYILKVTTGSQNPHDTKAWIDYNNNGEFEDDELVMEQSNTYDPEENIQIPDNIIYDTSFRLRISSDLVGSNNGPCDDVTSGQVEDYGIFASLCPSPENISIGEVTNNSVELIWSEGASETSWNVQYGPQGFSTQDQSGNIINNIFTHNFYVTGLEESVNYDFYVQSNCITSSSNWMGPYNTMTTSLENKIDDFIIKVFPNPNNGLLTIKSNQNFNKIEVFNLLGEKTKEYPFTNSNSLFLSIKNMPKGIYFIKIFLKNRVVTEKITYN